MHERIVAGPRQVEVCRGLVPSRAGSSVLFLRDETLCYERFKPREFLLRLFEEPLLLFDVVRRFPRRQRASRIDEGRKIALRGGGYGLRSPDFRRRLQAQRGERQARGIRLRGKLPDPGARGLELLLEGRRVELDERRSRRGEA